MLVNEVVNSKAIAFAATQNANNDIPYLGLQFFPTEKREGLDLKWIKTHSGLPVSLAPSNFDALPTLRARGGIDIQKTQMAFFREEMDIDETLAQEIDRAKSADDPYLRSALLGVYDDTNTLLAGAEVVPERMRMQLLATTNGHPVIGIQANGVNYAYDYDPNGTYAAKHYIKNQGTATWDNATTAKPITDLNNAKKALKKLGKTAKYALMNSNTFEYLMASEQVKGAILAQNVTANILLTEEVVKNAVKSLTGMTVVIYDKMFTDENGVDQYFYPNDKVTIIAADRLGKTVFGTTPEERTGRQVADVDVTIYGTGIAVAVKSEYGPPAITKTVASEVVLPSYEGMDNTYVIEVK